ncbi:MAG: hypothetical protein O3A00_02820 [Planctomycetota bacterium]|nr:hypothetical protein [Planctomycetota bacterium]
MFRKNWLASVLGESFLQRSIRKPRRRKFGNRASMSAEALQPREMLTNVIGPAVFPNK